MELFAANLDEARSAYAALSLRAQSAEATVATLQATVTSLNAIVPSMAAQNLQISRYAVAQLQANAQLATEQAQQVSPDVTLDAFVRALGLAAAVSEATMPDRTISELSATLQTYLTLGSSPDGSTSVGLRLYQPELGAPTATATLSFALAKVSPAAGSSAPPNLYSVMSAKQAVFSKFILCSVPVRRSGRHRSHERARRGIVVDVSLSDSRKLGDCRVRNDARRRLGPIDGQRHRANL